MTYCNKSILSPECDDLKCKKCYGKETMTKEELEAEGDWEQYPEKPFEIEMQ